jgi:hypothetical protein
MKKLVLAALLASFTFGASAAEKINFGISATYPPFESIGANNEIVGFDIDLAKALCKQMQAECTFTNHAFDSLIPSLKFRKYDAVISGMDITPERWQTEWSPAPEIANALSPVQRLTALHRQWPLMQFRSRLTACQASRSVNQSPPHRRTDPTYV